MYKSIWFVIRIAGILLLLGQAISPAAGQVGSLKAPSTPGAAQQGSGVDAYIPLETGTLPLELHHVRTFGVTGVPYPPEGQEPYLNSPAGLTVGPDNTVYVTENMGKRLRSYLPDGSAGFTVGTAGQEKEFWSPQDVALQDGYLWVVDSKRLLVYSTSGVLQQDIRNIDNSIRPDLPNYICAKALSFDDNGRLFLAQSCGSNNVVVLTVEGTLPELSLVLQSVIQFNGKDPQGVQVADLNDDGAQEVYLADNQQLWRCMEAGGWDCQPFGNGFQPRGLGLNPTDSGRLYVVRNDWNGPGILACDAGGNCIPYISNPPEQVLFDPVDVAFDTIGNAYITDRGDSTIKKYTSPTAHSVFAGTPGIPYVTPATPDPDYYYNGPSGVAVGSDYSVFILEEWGQRLTKLSDAGTFSWSFGVPGVAGDDSQHLNWPTGNPAVDSVGRIYIPDRNNSRITILDSAGNLLGYIGNQKNDPHYQFKNPSGLAIGPNGDIYVVDQGDQNVQIYTSDRFYQSSIGIKGEWGSDNAHFARPSGITVKDDRTVFVADSDNARVQQCTRPTASSTTWTCAPFVGVTNDPYWDNAHFDYPTSVAWDSTFSRLYVVDQNQNRLTAFDGTGKVLAVVGGDWGNSNAQFASPRSVTVDNVGNVYVADQNNQRVQKFIPSVPTVEYAGQIGGPAQHVVRSGSSLVVGSGPRLVVYDLTDVRHPSFTGLSDLLPREITGLAVNGSSAYDIMWGTGFSIMDLTSPSHPTLTGSLPIILPSGVAVKGNRAYVTTTCCGYRWSSARLYVIDVTDKANPQVVNYIEWNGPDSPKELAAVAIGGTGDGEYAYLANRWDGVIKVSVAGVNPTTPPLEIGRYSLPGVQVSGLALSSDESLAYLVDQNFGLRIIHTGGMNDWGLGAVQTRHDPWQDGDWSPTNISRDGDNLYLSGFGQGLGVFDVSDPADPSQVYHEVLMGGVDNVVAAGSLIYAARESLGLETLEFTPPPSPAFTLVDQNLQPAGSSGTAVTLGDFTYVASWIGGLRILDSRNPAALLELSASSLDTAVNGVTVLTPQPGSDTFAYLMTGRPGVEELRIVNVTDASNPQIAGQTSSLSGQLNVVGIRQTASGAPIYAFIPTSAWWGDPDGGGPLGDQFNNGALHVMDVTDPAAINESVGLTGAIITGNIYRGAFYEHYLLAAEGSIYDKSGNPYGGGLRVFDIEDPADPFEVAYFNKIDASGLAVLGDRLYLGQWGKGLSVWDISDTANPSNWNQIGFYPSTNSVYTMLSVQAIGERTYVTAGCGIMGMAVLDVTDPANIQLLEETGRLAGWGWSPDQVGHYVLFSSAGGGMYTFWSAPAAEEVILHQTGGTLVSAADGTVYTFTGGSLEADVRLRHVPVLPANIPPVASLLGIGHAFVISATDAANDRPVSALAPGETYTLEVTYTPQEMNGVTETSLSFYYWDGSTWVKQATTVDPATHKLTAHPDHFSLWTVLGTNTYNIYLPTISK
jgi:sugar lactone lactonase YvrE